MTESAARTVSARLVGGALSIDIVCGIDVARTYMDGYSGVDGVLTLISRLMRMSCGSGNS
ncbi:hypothetical protein DIPPA_30493 [Diplonema papillatum]|nr:hypothetical protein DIPPA_21898 [Diplonema papillatum]KAJ9439158.1 hypothetical protein DIPPA_30493 [Diplonema papillatum]